MTTPSTTSPSPPSESSLIPIDIPCTDCAHNLRGLDPRAACPHCGLRIAGSIPAPMLASIDAGGTVRGPAACIDCCYSLDGLPLSGDCPECGTPVERSLRAGLLRFSSPAHLATLHRGALLAELATIAIAPVCILTLAIELRSGGPTPGGAFVLSRPLAPLFWHTSIAAISVLMLIGWWMISRPDPAAAATDRAGPTLRAALVIQSIAMIAAAIVTLGRTSPAGPLSPSQLSTLFAVIGFLAWAGGLLASATLVRRLSRRIPDIYLHRQAHTLQLFTTIILGVLAGVAALVGTLVWISYEFGLLAVGTVMLSACLVIPAAAMALLIALVLDILLLDRLRFLLRRLRAPA